MTTDSQTIPQNDNEIIYRVSRRNPVYIIFANVLAYIFLTPISFLILSSDKAIHIFFGALLLLFIVHSFLKAVTFKELIIYKDKVVIDKKIFKKLVIDVNDIKSVYSGGYFLSSWTIFQVRGSYLGGFRYSIDSLYDEDEYKIRQIVEELIKGEKQ